MNNSALVQKLWNGCKVLRDDGMSHGDCVEQLSDLLSGSGRRCASWLATAMRGSTMTARRWKLGT